jgi:hypothetical protein
MIHAYGEASSFGSGYVAQDLNGDGNIDALDMLLLDNNAAVGVSVEKP